MSAEAASPRAAAAGENAKTTPFTSPAAPAGPAEMPALPRI